MLEAVFVKVPTITTWAPSERSLTPHRGVRGAVTAVNDCQPKPAAPAERLQRPAATFRLPPAPRPRPVTPLA